MKDKDMPLSERIREYVSESYYGDKFPMTIAVYDEKGALGLGTEAEREILLAWAAEIETKYVLREQDEQQEREWPLGR